MFRQTQPSVPVDQPVASPYSPHQSQQTQPSVPVDQPVASPSSPHQSQQTQPSVPVDQPVTSPSSPHQSQQTQPSVPVDQPVASPSSPHQSQQTQPCVPVDQPVASPSSPHQSQQTQPSVPVDQPVDSPSSPHISQQTLQSVPVDQPVISPSSPHQSRQTQPSVPVDQPVASPSSPHQSQQTQPRKPRVISDIILNDLAENLGHAWTKLAIHLGFAHAQIENFEAAYSRSQERQAILMLETWWQRWDHPNDEGEIGAVDALCDALRKTRRNDLVLRVRVVPNPEGSYAAHKMKTARPTRDMLDLKNTYQLMSKCKGLAFILNNSDFNRGQPREGSQIDTANMKHLFEELGYTTILRENLKGKDITKYFKEFASRFNQTGVSYDSAVIALMSHGNRGVILGTDNIPVKLENLQRELEPLQCPGLDGKPKMYFVQACRGSFVTTLPVNHDGPNPASDAQAYIQHPEEVQPDFVAVNSDAADVHFAYATMDGYLSLRDTVSGSFFVQALCEVFFGRAHLDNLDTLMNKVTDRVNSMESRLYDQELKRWVPVKQTPECVKRMRKAVYFLPNYP